MGKNKPAGSMRVVTRKGYVFQSEAGDIFWNGSHWVGIHRIAIGDVVTIRLSPQNEIYDYVSVMYEYEFLNRQSYTPRHDVNIPGSIMRSGSDGELDGEYGVVKYNPWFLAGQRLYKKWFSHLADDKDTAKPLRMRRYNPEDDTDDTEY